MQRGSGGILYLVIEAEAKSGLIPALRRKLAADARVTFPRRVITSAGEPGDEIHQTVTPAQFEGLRRSGAFALVWGSGGRNFALPATIQADLDAGKAVLAAAAPHAVAPALARFGRVAVAAATEVVDAIDIAALLACEEVVTLPTASTEAAAEALKGHIEATMPVLRPLRPSVAPRLPV